MASQFNGYLCLLILLVTFNPQIHCDKLLQLTEEQNRVFNFITGGLSQIVWTEDPLPPKLSISCQTSLGQIENALNQGEEWPFRFLDATSKSSSGLIDGTLSSLGDFDECLDLVAPDETFTGSYCLTQLAIRETEETLNITQTLRLRSCISDEIKLHSGLCIPSTCSKEDVRTLIEFRLQGYPLTLKPEIICNSPEEISWLSTIKSISIAQLISILFLSAIGGLVAIGTQIQIADLLLQYILEVKFEQFSPAPKLTNFLTKCSVVESLMALLTCKSDKRSVSTFKNLYLLLVLAETAIGSAFLYHLSSGMLTIYRLAEFKDLTNSWLVPFSSHAILSALFFAWGRKVQLACEKYGKNIFVFAISHILTTSICATAVIALQLILPMLASGPIWTFASNQVTTACKSNWWRHTFLVANFASGPNECVPHLVILSILCQLLLIGLAVSLTFKINSMLGFSVTFGLLALFTGNFLSDGSSLSSPVFLDINGPKNVFNYLTLVHNSLSSHAISFLLGLLSANLIRNSQKLPTLKIVAALATAISLYGPMLHTHHQIIGSNFYPHFLLIIKLLSCIGTLFLGVERATEVKVTERTKKQPSQDESEQDGEEEKEPENEVCVSKAVGRLAPSMLFVSLLYIYGDFFTSRLLLPISPFAVLKRSLYSLVYIFGLSFPFHLFVYSPIKTVTRNIFASIRQ